MATYQELRARSQQVRDEQNIGGNTALRVGQLLMDIVKYFYDNDSAASEYLQQHFAMVNDGTQLLNWQQSPIVILHTMGTGYDDDDYSALSQGENYYRNGFIMEANGQGGGINGETPKVNVLYVNLANDTLYTWNGASFDAITSGGGGGISGDDILKNAYYLNGNLVLVFDTEGGDKTVSIPVNFDAQNYVPTSRTVNGKALSQNITISQSDIPGLVAALAGKISGIRAYGASTTLPVDPNGVVELPPAGSTISPATATPSMDGTANVGSSAKYAREDHVHPHDSTKLSQSDVSVESQGDGTVDINVKDDTYTINLNHTHENMVKLVVCEESDLPSTLDNSTIYAITDSGETEIEKLIIRGMEFAGGGGAPSTDPKIVNPIGTQIDFNGESTKSVTVKAANLSESLTIAVTGITASLQTISASDAANGVQLTLTRDQNFAGGTLRIYSSEVDKSWNVVDTTLIEYISGVKLNGSQWLLTDYIPNANTALELKFKLTKTAGTTAGADRFFMRTASNGNNAFLIFPDGNVGSTKWCAIINANSATKMTSTISEADFFADNAILRFQSGTLTFISNGTNYQVGSGISVPTLNAPISICGRITNGVEKIYNYSDVNIYEFKIWESGTLMKHYKPAIFQGVIGLYDVVNDDFISSESSTSLIALEN